MVVAFQETTVGVAPFTVTVLEPCEAPKPTPLMVTGVCGWPPSGDKELMYGLMT